MKVRDVIVESIEYYYHGSYYELPIGMILTPRSDYEERWNHTDFYNILEHYRPVNSLSHKKAVFMAKEKDDVDLAGGATDYLVTAIPLGKVEKHDMNWSSDINKC